MMAVFEEVVAPAARRFQPDIILVSCYTPPNHQGICMRSAGMCS